MVMIYLDLSNNLLSEWPGTIKLKYLETLKLNNNQISVIPDKISELRSLKALDLSENNLNLLPEKMKYLKNIKINELRESKKKIIILNNNNQIKLITILT